MTQPTIQRIQHTRATDFVKEITFTEDTANFEDAWFTVRTDWATSETDDTTAIASGSILGGEMAITGTYTATIEFADTVTRDWTLGSYVYDVKVKELASGKILPAIRGVLVMGPDATRST
jgi:hypothetical protein